MHILCSLGGPSALCKNQVKPGRGAPGDGCIYSRQATLRLLVGVAFLPGCQAGSLGHISYPDKRQGIHLGSKPSLPGKKAREKGLDRTEQWFVSSACDEARRPCRGQSGTTRRATGGAGKEPGTQLRTRCQRQLCP